MRQDSRRIQFNNVVKRGARIRVQTLPVRYCVIEQFTFGCEWPASQVLDRFFVYRHHARARTRFDRHIADRHAAFHRQRTNSCTRKLDRVTGPACGANLADDGEHDILGRHTAPDLALYADQQRFRFFRHQALRGHDVLDFRCADAERQRGKCAVRGGMRIAANDSHARQRRALLRADHVDDSLTRIMHAEIICYAEFLDV